VRKLFTVLTALGLVVALGGTATAKKGPLRVATSLPGPGFFDGGDTPEDINGGYEYAIAKELAKRLGYDGITLKNVSFDALVAGTVKGFDIAFSQVTILPERAKVVDFSTPYFSSDIGILVRTGDKVTEKNQKKIQWGVQTATTSQTFLEKKVKPEKEPRSYEDLSAAFAALQAGQIDAVLIDTAIVLGEANQSNGKFEVVGQYKTGEAYGAIFPKHSKIENKVNKTLKAMIKDGTVAKFSDKYLKPAFGEDPSKVPYLKP